MTMRADHVGSLLRPASLLRARQEHAERRLSDEDLRSREDAAILDALAHQRDVGLPVVSDGELRRGSWITGLADAIDGFVPRSRVISWQGPGGRPEESTSQVVGGRLHARRRLTGHESAFLAEHAGGLPYKVTLPAPANVFVVSWMAGVTDAVYASRTELLDDAVRIIRAEVEAMIAYGVPYVQLDAPFYSSFVAEGSRSRLRSEGVDPDQEVQQVVAADDAGVRGLAREGLTLALHVCRGNSRSRWLNEGAYDPIAEALLGTLGGDGFLLGYDTPRSGSFDALRYLPAGRAAGRGLVTTKEPRLETRDELLRRIEEAARHAPIEQLAL